ncbi:MAG: membrane dipeptidase [Acutalibacteraceae bacterium]|nr:membrane dipeptidase [Acutalibacteraceae bacterium]
MKFFDLHCDTIGECSNNNFPLRNNNLHIDLERANAFENYTQVFAIWIPDEFRKVFAVEYFNKAADYFYNELEKNNDLISLYGDKKETPIKALLAVEGASACGGTIEGLHHLYDKRVRLITLTWNAKNEIGSGAFSEGGLTSFGKDFIKEAENLGITLDVSHLNRQSFFEFAEIAKKPFIASHSNADIVNNEFGKKRNLSNEQIAIIKERNGLIGLNFCRDFIEDENADGVDALYRQIEYFLSSGCENNISFGSDFDGCPIHSDLSGIEKMPSVYTALKERGVDEKILKKLFWENAEKFFV